MASDAPVVLGLGDSWMKDGDSQTFPRQLTDTIGAVFLNYAEQNALSDALPTQLDKFSAQHQRADAFIIHVGGNNLLGMLGKLTENEEMKRVEESLDMVCDHVVRDTKETSRSLIKMGVKRGVVADVPFSTQVPGLMRILQGSVEQNMCSTEEAEKIAQRTSEAMNRKTRSMIQDLRKEWPESTIIQFEENLELQKWTVEENLVDETQLHPNHEGHAKLQEALLDVWIREDFPKGSANPPSCSTHTGDTPLTPQTGLGYNTNNKSLDEQFNMAGLEVGRLHAAGLLSVQEQLKFYGLYKQGKFGDNKSEPSKYIRVGKESAKWAAWFKERSKPESVAKSEYVATLNLKKRASAD